MSRFGEGDGEEFPGQYELWQSNVVRAIRGKAGQRALRDLEAALLALPEKRLISGHLAHRGEVCTMGALIAHRRATAGEERAAVLAELEALAPSLCECNHPESEHRDGVCAGCIEATHWWNDARTKNGGEMRWGPPRLCAEFIDSDETEDSEQGGWITVDAGKRAGLTYVLAWELAYRNDEHFQRATPEERYEKVLEWTREHLVDEPVAA